MKEIWKDIKDYEGKYQVSNFGRVKSLERLDSNNHRIKEKILCLKQTNCGYMNVGLRNHGKKFFLVHRLVAEAFISNPQNKPQVNHIDGNKQNNCVENLEWCTSSENQIHAYKTGLNHSVCGEQHGISKLTWEDIDWIREHYSCRSKEFGGRALAQKFGVSPSLITYIVQNKIWRSENGR